MFNLDLTPKVNITDLGISSEKAGNLEIYGLLYETRTHFVSRYYVYLKLVKWWKKSYSILHTRTCSGWMKNWSTNDREPDLISGRRYER